MKLTLSFNMDNAAFADDPASEASDILQAVATQIREGLSDGLCVDVNGNKVGNWFISV